MTFADKLREEAQKALNARKSDAQLAVKPLVPAALERCEKQMLEAARRGEMGFTVDVQFLVDIPTSSRLSDAMQREWVDRRYALARLVTDAFNRKHPELRATYNDATFSASWGSVEKPYITPLPPL